MRKVRFLLLLVGLCWFSGQYAFLYAQDTEDEDDPDYNEGVILETDEWDNYMDTLYSRGDKTFTISLGVEFPTLFFDYEGKQITHNFTPPVGGSLGPLAYTYFLNSHFFVGGELAFFFNYTLGQNTIFFIPIGLRTGWQFVIYRFEIPLSLTVGIAPQRYLGFTYLGLFAKVEASAYYRFSPDWSFGLNVNWNWYPQWPLEGGNRAPQKDIYGNLLGLTLAARYHF